MSCKSEINCEVIAVINFTFDTSKILSALVSTRKHHSHHTVHMVSSLKKTLFIKSVTTITSGILHIVKETL